MPIIRAAIVVSGILFTTLLSLFALLWVLLAPSRDVVTSVRSPDGAYVVHVVEINGGATTSFAYEVLVESTRWSLVEGRVASLYAAVRSKQAYGVNLRWTSANELHVEYLEAVYAELREPTIPFLAPEVRAVLVPGVADPNAPPGGMLYSLQASRSGG